MRDISKKTFWIILISLIILRILMVLFLMHDIPQTGVQEGGWWFVHGGDERTYFNLAKTISQLKLEKSIVTLGFPLFLAPFIHFADAVQVEDILKPIFIINAFLLFSLSIVLIGLIAKRVFQSRIIGNICAGMFTFYPYVFYLFFNQVGPYYEGVARGMMAFQSLNWLQIISDSLSAFLVYFCFYLFLIEFNKSHARKSSLMLLGILSGFATLVRIGNILFIGIFILGWLLKRRIKEPLLLGVFSFLLFLPQLIYNYIFFASPLRFGYEVYSGQSLSSVFSISRWIHLFERASFYIPGFIFLLLSLIILLALGIRFLWEKDRIVSLILVFWFFSYLLFYGSFIEGGFQPRFFIPAIPPLIILSTASFLYVFQWIRQKFFIAQPDY